MEERFFSVKMDGTLRNKINELARAERRSCTQQAALLVEIGLSVIEKQKKMSELEQAAQ